MAKQQNDLIQTISIDPIILNPKTVNTFLDATLLRPEELAIGNNIITDNGVIEKIPGAAKINTSSGAAVVRGLHRAYGPASEKIALKLDNGVLRSGLSAFGTSVLTGLASTLITPFVNARGKSYGVNTTDGVIRYDPKQARGVKTGIVGPFLRKKIAFFESDETWSTANGGSQVTELYRPDEWTGKAIQALKLAVASASSNSFSSYSVNLDLSVFDNSKTSDADDYISFHTFHNQRDNIDYITVEFSTGDTAFTTKKMVTLYKDEFEEGDYEWTFWKVRKSAFIDTGSPDWSAVKAIRIYAYSASTGAVTIYVDFMHLRVTLLELKELRKQISSFNQSETWVNASGATFPTDNQVFYEDFCSRKITANAINYRAISADLSKWPDGKTSQTSDEICIRIRTTAKANVSCAYVRLGYTGGTSYWNYRISSASYTGNDQWIDKRIKKSQFSAVGGMSAWASIRRLDVGGKTIAATTMYFDDLRMEQAAQQKQLANCEASETWTFTNGEISTYANGIVQGDACVLLEGVGSKMGEATGTVALSASRNLTTWDDGTGSSTDDPICFNLFHRNLKNVEKITVYCDHNNSNFVNYYWYEVSKSKFATNGVKNNQGKEIQIKKSDFKTVGSPNWNAITDIRFTAQNKNGGDVYVDNVTMKRQEGQTGRYYYKYLFGFDDIKSAFSEVSDYIDVKGSYVSIGKAKSSVDSRIKIKEFCRLGGDFPNTWMRIKITDNSTEEFVDKALDSDLDDPLGQDAPTGNINSVPCSNLVYDAQSDTVIYWQHTDYKNRAYQSNPAYHWIVNELSYREFSSDVMFVIPWYGQYIVGLKNKIIRIAGDFRTGELIEIPVVDGACSVTAACKISEGLIAFAGWKNVYLLDGYRATPIGNNVRNYFKGREAYLSSVAVEYWDNCLWIACKAATGTPTYNNVVLRYHLPSKAWLIVPNWNVNVWTHFNDKDDDDSLWYGDSNAATGDVYKINSSTYRFGSSAISSEAKTGWFGVPDHEMRIYEIELKAKGTVDSTLTVKGYKDLSEATAMFTGTITLTANWKTYTLQGPVLRNKMVGDVLELDFTHSTDNATFYLKDIKILAEKIPKRNTFSEVTLT